MRSKLILVLLLLLVYGTAAQAAVTTVTGTVVDPNGVAYKNGTISAYVPGDSPTYAGPWPTDVNGTFSFSITSRVWYFKVCTPAIVAVPPNPVPYGTVCFTAGPITISGGSQSITTQLDAAAIAINPNTQPSAVSSVFTRTGAVVAAANDYNFNQIAGTATSTQVPLSATTTALASTPTKCSAGNYPLGVDTGGNAQNCTAAASGGLSGMTATQIPVAATASTVTSSIATTGTGNVVLATSPTLVTPVLGTPTSGTLTNATGLPEGGLALTDITTNNVSTSKHGFAPKGDANAAHYLDGTGAYSTPAGGTALTTYTPFATSSIGTATGVTLTANRVFIYYIEFPVAVSAGHIQSYWPIGDTNGAHNYSVGIYSGCLAGATATLVANTAVIHPATATLLSTAFAQGTVAFPAGSYCLAVTGDNITANFLVTQATAASQVYNPLAGTDSAGWNHPTATSSAGVFPGTFTVPASAALASQPPYITQLQP